MSNEKVLTKEIAEQFRKKKNSVDLSRFTAIEDAAAESLSKHEGWLNLSGLTSLSDAAAESLSKHEGRRRGRTAGSAAGPSRADDPTIRRARKVTGGRSASGVRGRSIYQAGRGTGAALREGRNAQRVRDEGDRLK